MNYKLQEHKRQGRVKISDSKYLADTRILTRILIVIENKGYSNMTSLARNGVCSNNYKVKDGLNWLINHGFIEEFMSPNSVKLYCLKGKKQDMTQYLKLKEKLNING